MTRNLDESANNDLSRRDFLAGGLVAGAVTAGSLGAFYYGYDKAVGNPVRVGVLGTGDEGSVLLGAINPKFMEVAAIADVRPYNVFRAFHGEYNQPARPGLMKVYGWKTETEARKHVKVYGKYDELLANAKRDGIEAIIIALPLHLHAPAAIAAMNAGLHVITEKLMAHSVGECKDMARVANRTGVYLAVGHQRHYNILYAQATEKIRRGVLGDLHYIKAQWHRSNMPGKDSWSMPLPPGIKDKSGVENDMVKKLKTLEKKLKDARGVEIEDVAQQIAQAKAQIADCVLHTKDAKLLESIGGINGAAGEAVRRVLEIEAAGKTPAEALGYESIKVPAGTSSYDRPAIEELIRWRLWDRTGGGLMAELGSHQLDASSIFIAAAHGGEKQHPLSVVAGCSRSLFPRDRDVEDHVFCIIEFPAPGYDAKDPIASRKKIGVQYSSINGNGFGGYGEIVFGTKGTLILEREQLMHEPASGTEIKVTAAAAGPTMDTQSSGPARALATSASGPVSRGYTEELEHFAWCVRNKAPENKPRCHPEVAMGDAIIALVTNQAAREGKRIEFDENWFKIQRDETPDKPPTVKV